MSVNELVHRNFTLILPKNECSSLTIPDLNPEREGDKGPEYHIYSVMQSEGTLFADMSSRTASRRHLGMKTTFKTKYMKVNMFVLLI